MADTKISALPSATTPVAGSEVLPIVQSGTTTKVSIDNLTTGKNVPMLGVAATGLSALGSALNANWASASKGAQLGTYGAVYQLEVDATVALASNALVSNATTGATKYIASAAASRVNAGVGTLSLDIAIAGTAGAVIGANWASALSTDTTYNVTLPSGNLVIGTSGKGIDFSATPGTGTSELLADYEEGTWTPVVAPNSGAITSYTSNGTYIKIGKIVVVSTIFTITNNGTGAGLLLITGLPFTPLEASMQYASSANNRSTANTLYGEVANAKLQVYTALGLYPGVTGQNYCVTATYFTS